MKTTDSTLYSVHAACAQVKPADAAAMKTAASFIDTLAMPPGSMGKLQQIAVQLAGITGSIKNCVEKKRIIVVCADNGVVAEGIASAPQQVTAAQAVNMTKGRTGMSAIAAGFGDEVQVVDVGICTPYTCGAVIKRRVRNGSGNIFREPAMTRAEAEQCLLTGITLAEQAKNNGVQLLGTGEMGIGNTTTSAAVLSVLTDTDPAEITGRGGGITDVMLSHKKQVVAHAVLVNAPDKRDAVDVMAKVGGLDIATMCGIFIGAAIYHIPVVIDGYISIVAALCAVRLAPDVKDYLFASHRSAEPGYTVAARSLGVDPFLNLDMRLGEGSGCPLAFRIIEAACAMVNGMATFDGAGIDDSYLCEVRDAMGGR